MTESKKLLLTNKSARTFVTSLGKFYPGTSKEFDEKEAMNLLGYSKEVVRSEDAHGPEFKDRVAKLERRIIEQEAQVDAKDKVIKELREEIAKGPGPQVYDELKAKNAKIVELEEEIEKHIADKKAVYKEKDEKIAELKKALKEAKKK